jgi:hypothetical protein
MRQPAFVRLILVPLALLGSLTGGLAVRAEVVRPAPDFWLGPLSNTNSGSTETLKGQRGRPVIVLLARSPETGAFRSQMKEIASRFDRLSTRNVLVVAAFEEVPSKGFSGLVQSDVPVVVAPKGAEVCRQFGLQTLGSKSAIALIGPDGNLDYMTAKILTASRISQVIGNSFQFQHDPKRKPLALPSAYSDSSPLEEPDTPTSKPSASKKEKP